MSEMNLYQALLSAQKAMAPVIKSNTNPAFKSKYADLSTVLDAITPALHANGLVVVQRFDMDGGGPVLATDIIHADTGERLTSTIAITCKDPLDPQKMGSAITYYRRYSLLALAGVAPEDDDAAGASQPAARQSTPVARPDTPRRMEPVAVGTTATATSQPYPATKIATWTDDQLWAYACDESGQEAKRKATFSQYLSRLATDVDVLFASEQMKALHPEDVASLRDAALAALRQPAGVAG